MNSLTSVGQGRRPILRGPNEITFNGIPRRTQSLDEDAVAGVAGDEIAGAGRQSNGRGAADDVIARIAKDAFAVGQSGRPGRVRADKIAGDGIAAGIQLDSLAAEIANHQCLNGGAASAADDL